MTDASRAPGDSTRPERIGDYAILDVLGEGGMGTIYLAEHRGPIRRKVAVKAIKLGMDTREVVARFEAERQALALLNHQNVAQVFDAGATDAGRPYFVMEYVAGQSLIDYCDARELGVAERLALFEQVCRGAHHAHEHGIVHRDLKPSNILVREQDGRAVPKIIDFGVAKAIDRRLTERTLLTEHGQILGTPEYMSPEQAERRGQGVDARSDVYSLGVLLYELLVGALPFDAEALRDAGYPEIQRQICEVEPQTPSKRLTTSMSVQAGEEAARRRRTTVGSLMRELRGDLDWIVMKALQKDPERRYGSARELADDVARHARGEPILAGPPSIGYRARRLWHRHARRAIVALVGVLIVGFAILYVVEMRRNTRLREELDDLRGQNAAATLALPLTGGAVDVARQTTAARSGGRDLIERALPRYRKILALERRAHGAESKESAESMRRLAQANLAVGKQMDALKLFERCVEIQIKLRGADAEETATALNDLAACQHGIGRFRDAVNNYAKALSILERVHDEPDPLVATTRSNLGVACAAAGRMDDAAAHFNAALEIRRALYPDRNDDVQNARGLLAFARASSADAPGAIVLIEEALQAHAESANAGGVIDAGASLARTLRESGELDRALEIQLQLLQTCLLAAPDGDAKLQATKLELAATLVEKGDFETAEQFQAQVLAERERIAPDDVLAIAEARSHLAHTHVRLGEIDDARALDESVVSDLERRLPPGHPRLLDARAELARTLAIAGEREQAATLMLDVYEVYRREHGADAPATQGPRSFVYAQLPHLDDAVAERLRARLDAIER